MKFFDTEIPAELLNAGYDGSLVIFAGAGVSMQYPVRYPSFESLLSSIKKIVDPINRQRERHHETMADDSKVYLETPEQYLSFLNNEIGGVKSACCSILTSKNLTSDLHRNLLRLFKSPRDIRIVTTNFDDCFEIALNESKVPYDSYAYPAVPFGNDFKGLIHLHGSIKNPDETILLAEDYGRAYVTNGRLSRFLVELFEKNVVLFVGYSCGDSLVDYLTRSISTQIRGNAYALCRADDNVSDWLLRGVIPIFYGDHEHLPEIIEKWATYYEQSISTRIKRIREIARHAELSSSDKEYVLHSFNWHNEKDRELFVQEFCSASTCFNHLEFIVKNMGTTFLTSQTPNEIEQRLLWWSVSKFSVSKSKEFRSLCLLIKSNPSAQFWQYLTYYLFNENPPEEIVGEWIGLLELMPTPSQSCSYYLLGLMGQSTAPEIVLSIIRVLLRVKLLATKSVFEEVEQEATILANDDYFMGVISESLSKHKNEIGCQVFDYCFQQIEIAYSIQTNCWTAPNVIDSISFSRRSVGVSQFGDSEVSLHESASINMLLDTAIEALNFKFLDQIINRCLDSKCNLLIRLGLWLVKTHACSGDALKMLDQKDCLSNSALHHEVYELIGSSFPIATDAQRDDFLDYLEVCLSSGTMSDYELYNLCNWILKTFYYERVARIRDNIQSANPSYLPREQPEYNYWITCEFVENSFKSSADMASVNLDKVIDQLKGQNQSTENVQKIECLCEFYSEVAFKVIQKLVSKERAIEETELCNLFISKLNWSSLNVPSKDAKKVFLDILSKSDLCVAAIKALYMITSTEKMKIDFDATDLADMLKAASTNVKVLLNEETMVEVTDNPDWLFEGINHPAGQYFQLIKTLKDISSRELSVHNMLANRLIAKLDLLSIPESVASKSLIACCFQSLDFLIEVDKGYAKKLINLLSEDKWSCVPAWQGMLGISRVTSDVWELTNEAWKLLFRGRVKIKKNLGGELARVCVKLAIMHAEKIDKTEVLKLCGSWSRKAYEGMCRVVDMWMKSLTTEEKMEAWDGVLSEVFKYLASAMTAEMDILLSLYCSWIWKYPVMRTVIAKALERDCEILEVERLLLPDNVLNEVSLDENLNPSEAALIIAFLLGTQKFLMDPKDARSAAANIDLTMLSQVEVMRIQDAYARKGLVDVVFKNN